MLIVLLLMTVTCHKNGQNCFIDTNITGGGGETDYTPGPYAVTFHAGMATASFDVPIVNDKHLHLLLLPIHYPVKLVKGIHEKLL